MPLASTTRLTPHFTAAELGADLPSATGDVLKNLQQITAPRLEVVRGILGVPLRVTSGYRPPLTNLAVGGSETSDHPRGLAADVVPVGMSQYAAYQLLSGADVLRRLPPWDQIIYYPGEGHVHFGFGERTRREVRVKMFEGPGGTPLLTADLVGQLRGFV